MNEIYFTELSTSWIVYSEIKTLRQRIIVSIITTSMVKQVQKFPKRDLILCIAISPYGALRGRPLIKGDSPPSK